MSLDANTRYDTCARSARACEAVSADFWRIDLRRSLRDPYSPGASGTRRALLDQCVSWPPARRVFRRAKDLQQIYLDTEHFSNKDFAPFAKLVGDKWSQVPAETDPPMHGPYRAIINPLFTQIRMRNMESRVREIAREYITKFKIAVVASSWRNSRFASRRRCFSNS